MSTPDAHQVADAMRAVVRQLNRARRGLIRAAPCGDCAIDAAADTEFPSSNGNAITGLGIEVAPGAAEVAAWLDAYRAAGVRRCFAWVHQGRCAEATHAALAAAGFRRFAGPDYPTLIRGLADAPPAASCPFAIVELDAARRERERAALSGLYRDVEHFLAIAALPGATTVAALHAGTPIACSVLMRVQGWAWLGWMGTAEEHRRRGAQRALIAARLALAARECRWAIAETLSILAASRRNLDWAGFTQVYDRQVWMAELAGPPG